MVVQSGKPCRPLRRCRAHFPPDFVQRDRPTELLGQRHQQRRVAGVAGVVGIVVGCQNRQLVQHAKGRLPFFRVAAEGPGLFVLERGDRIQVVLVHLRQEPVVGAVRAGGAVK